MEENLKPYRPSNGTEGDGFMACHCYQCLFDNPDPDKNPKCDILTASMVYGIDDDGYPRDVWVWKNGKPTCLKFVKWDWDNGDPNDPDNPNKPPDPPDPRQLNLFPLYHPELLNELQKQMV